MKHLKNPKTIKYKKLKKTILSNEFPWFYVDRIVKNADKRDDNPTWYSHGVLTRPVQGTRYPKESSPYLPQISEVLEEIFVHNNINTQCIYRININAVHPPVTTTYSTVQHVDHDFPHKNLIIYLTDAGGDTLLYQDDNIINHTPSEDDIISFSGLHSYNLPTTTRRVVLVCTYM